MLTTDVLKNKDINFVKLFQDQANKNPEKCAVVFQGKELTYKQLDLYSNKIAHMIKKNNVNQKSVILLISNPLSQISAMIGVLKSGLCYIPLDPSYPEETNETIIRDSCAKIILTEDTQLSLIKKAANIGMEVLSLEDAQHHSLDNLNENIAHDDNSYILYTSGSTGKPKGVVHNHRNLLHLITVYCRDIEIKECDRFSYLYSYSFSAGLKDVFAPLVCGATIYPYLIKKEGIKGLIAFLRNNQITVYHSVPTVFRHLCDELKEGDCFPDLRLISLGSEAITNKDIELYAKYFQNRSLLHIEYGITEAGVIAQNLLSKDNMPQNYRVPVGSSIFGKCISILDDSDNPVKPNEIGEIVVESAYVAKGYWKQGDLDVLKVSHFQDGLETRVFRTGDLGRWCDNGILEHLGRKDNQVKILGHKVNIAELEIILNNLNQIDEAIVIPKEDKAGDNSLTAFVVQDNDSEQNVASLIREQLKQKIPEYMIPARFIKLDQIPKLPNGKTDRQKLISELEELKEEKKVYSEDIIEQTIALIYADTLDIMDFNTNDSIFALGANSIKVSQVCGIIEELFDIDFPVSYIFNYQSVAGLTKLLIEREGKAQLETKAQQFIEMGCKVIP